jgi:hypothetical protein
MGRRPAISVHPIGCACRTCAYPTCRSHRTELAIKGATRTLFLIAAIIAIPFIIAHALVSAKENAR